jgi:phosphoglycolate phosphatase-like HAD superfamily hydrolase
MTGSVQGFAVFDIDGVLADVRHRLHHVQSPPKNWDLFFASMDEDPLLPEGQTLAREWVSNGAQIAYLTGRNESHRATTQTWLEANALPPGRLLMRPDRDRRPARLYKPEALQRLARDGSIVVVVDDDLAVIETLRAQGYQVLHATWMDTAKTEQQSLFDAQEVEGRS